MTSDTLKKIIQLKEWSHDSDQGIGIRLSDSDRATLERMRKHGIEIYEQLNGLHIRTKSHVGHVSFDSFELRIEPKIDDIDLHKLFCYAFNLKQIRLFDKQSLHEKRYEEILIAELLEEIEGIQRRGLFQQYTQKQRDLEILRGRVDLNKWMHRGDAPTTTLPCRYYQRNLDNIMNQTLSAGLGRIGTMNIAATLKSRSRSLAGVFSKSVREIPLSVPLISKAFQSLNRLNSHYEPSIRLIQLLHSGIGGFIDGKRRDHQARGFLFDMNMLFQAILGRFLHENLNSHSVHEQETFPVYHFIDDNKPIVIKPDFVLHDKSTNNIVIIADAKYRDLCNYDLPSSILYQLSVYAAVCPTMQHSVILYPTTTLAARSKTLRVNRIHGNRIATVKLHPINLHYLTKLIDNATSPMEKERFAKSLFFSEKFSCSNE